MGIEHRLQVEYRPYRRPLRQPLFTKHSIWSVREGVILQLVDRAGAIGWGEMAPLPWFGSETLTDVLAFCQSLNHSIDLEQIATIPSHLPCCQFAFESAWEQMLSGTNQPMSSWPTGYSRLLPTGEAALTAWRSHWQHGDRTFKWKIGIAPIELELAWLEQLANQLPAEVKLRLDANGGLTIVEAQQWLRTCDRLSCIEYLEQPLPPSQMAELEALAAHYTTQIALDESVANLTDLDTWGKRGWQGVVVVKPAIVGSPRQLRQVCQRYPLDIVLSSALETAIARQAGLRLAAELGNRDRACGYGITHWFNDNLSTATYSHLWQTLSP